MPLLLGCYSYGQQSFSLIIVHVKKVIYYSRTENRYSTMKYCLCTCYRYIVQYAAECGGVIVSTDNYRDLLQENPAWRETIERRWGKFKYNSNVTYISVLVMYTQNPKNYTKVS